MTERLIEGGSAAPVYPTNDRPISGGAAKPVIFYDPETGEFADLIDAEHANALTNLDRDIVQDPITLSTSTAIEGGIAKVRLNYTTFDANIGGDWYQIPAGTAVLNEADTGTPAIYYVYAELSAGVPVVTVNTIPPDGGGVTSENYAWIAIVKLNSNGGVATVYYVMREFTAAYRILHNIGDYSNAIVPAWVNGFGMTINATSGAVSLESGQARRLIRDIEFAAVNNGTILLDNETSTVANLELITTYADGSAITAGKYHKLLLGAVVGVDALYKIKVMRQAKPSVEYATLESARIDSERKAATSFGSGWRSVTIPIAYIEMLVGDASDSTTQDLRETGITGGGGGGVPITNHGALTGLADDDHLQYLPRSGTRAMTGDLDMGGNDIANAGTIKSGNVSGGNYTETETDGTLHFVGNATVWRDINFGVGALGTGASAPDLVSVSGSTLQLYGFDGNVTTEQLYASTEVDHDVMEGSTLYPHIHWMPSTNNAGNVKWQLEYSWVNRNGTIAGSSTISATQAAGGTAWKHNFIGFSSIDGTGKQLGSQLILRLFRNPQDAEDTYPNDAVLITFGIHVELDTTGSRTISTK